MFKRIITLLFVATITALMLMACVSNSTQEEMSVSTPTVAPTEKPMAVPDCNVELYSRVNISTKQGQYVIREELIGSLPTQVYSHEVRNVIAHRLSVSESDFEEILPKLADVAAKDMVFAQAVLKPLFPDHPGLASYYIDQDRPEGFRFMTEEVYETSWDDCDTHNWNGDAETIRFYFDTNLYQKYDPKSPNLSVEFITEDRVYLSLYQAGSETQFWLPIDFLSGKPGSQRVKLVTMLVPYQDFTFTVMTFEGTEIAAFNVMPQAVHYRSLLHEVMEIVVQYHYAEATLYVAQHPDGQSIGSVIIP